MAKRVQWTEFEQDTLYSGTVSILKDKPKLKLAEAVRMAQVALPENRRRKYVLGPSQIPDSLRNRFILNGYLDKNWNSKASPSKEDPRDAHIAELQAEVEGQKQAVVDLLNDLKAAREELARLRSQPDAFTVVQRWVAQTLAMALSQADAEKKGWTSVPPVKEPAEAILERYSKEPIPEFERARRKDPTPTPGTGDLRPKFALIADFVGVDKHTIHQAVSDVANPRYLDSGTKLEGMKAFHSNGGKVIVWASHTPHDWEAKLQGMGVTFKRFHGSTQGLIDHIRHEAVKK